MKVGSKYVRDSNGSGITDRYKKSSPTPLKSFNLNSRKWNGKPESFDRLMTELKALMKGREEETSIVDQSLQNLQIIRPQLTNPKLFWSKSEDEDITRDGPKYSRTVLTSNEVLEGKVMSNVFRPIKSDFSSEGKTLKMKKIRSTVEGKEERDEVEEEEEEKNKKKKEKSSSIHESLRMQKIKRRTSLPFNWDKKDVVVPGEDIAWNEENVKTYDISYYSTILKRMNHQDGSSEYYSSGNSKKGVKGRTRSVKSASDECIFDDRYEGTNRMREDEEFAKKKEKSGQGERISVTEPSSPFVSSYSIQLEKASGAAVERYYDSDSDSEATRNNVILRDAIKKSKSFAEEKEIEINYCRKKSDALLGARVSPSSYDSSRCSRTLSRKPLKSKSEVDYGAIRFLANQTALTQVHKTKKAGKRGDKKEDEEGGKRSQSCTRHGVDPDIFQHLLDVLMQKNRAEGREPEWTELWTKSLPRHLKQEHVKGKRAENTWGKVPICGPDPGFDRFREAKAPEVGKFPKPSATYEKKGDARVPAARNPRPKKKLNEEECVIQIEDKKLWIEICKAVKKVDSKGRKPKKCS